jgi:hypothetical protein
MVSSLLIILLVLVWLASLQRSIWKLTSISPDGTGTNVPVRSWLRTVPGISLGIHRLRGREDAPFPDIHSRTLRFPAGERFRVSLLPCT